MPKISVLIPIYNVEKYLAACLDSLLAQTYTDWEAICVVDGSPDNSAEILELYAKKDSRIIALTQENKGVSAARNRALQAATGEYICYLDPDDEYSPFYLERLYNAVKDNNAEIAYCDYVRDKNLLSTSHEEPKYYTDVFDKFVSKALDIGVYIGNKIYRKELIKSISYPEDIKIAEDMVFHYRVMYTIKSIAHVPERLYFYRVRSDSVTNVPLSKKIIVDNFKAAALILKEFKDKEMTEEARNHINKRMTYRFFKFAVTEPIHSEGGARKKEWYAITYPMLLKYKEEGLYQPKYLSLKNRLRSWLFFLANHNRISN